MVTPFSRQFRVEHGSEETSLILVVYIYVLECVALRPLIMREPKNINFAVSPCCDACMQFRGSCSVGIYFRFLNCHVL